MKLLQIIFSFLLITLFSKAVVGQEIISGSGGTDTTKNTQVTWNLGEPIIGLGSSGSIDVTQGYVQPIFLIVSLEEVKSNNISLNIFPNPANQEFNLVLEGNLESIFYVRISNINGQLVKEESFVESKHKVLIDDLLPATYFVEIQNETGSYYNKLKLVKTH